MERCHHPGKFLAFTSSKGDVGKINIVTYQAIHMVASGKKALLRDERLISAVRQRKPVVLAYPRAGISLSTATLAAKLCNISVSLPNNDKFFKKVIGWFF